ncbi:MAG: 16S rRNA (guanine(966)-N(2))-methyltransferase RsmD [Brevinema sp.]
MLRISSGQWRGRRLLAPEGELKPTTDRIRQAVFNIFRPHIFGARFLDLFAGSGSVGITALSEGASFAAFVEHDPRTYRALRQNTVDLEIPREKLVLHKSDALTCSNLFSEPFDLIFADPFYADVQRSFINRLHGQAFKLLDIEGILIIEHGSKVHKEWIEDLEGWDNTKVYGDTSLSVFKK